VHAFLETLATYRTSAQTLLVQIIGAGPRAAARRDAISTPSPTRCTATPAGGAALRRQDVRLARRRLRDHRRLGRARSRSLRTGQPPDCSRSSGHTRLMLGALDRA